MTSIAICDKGSAVSKCSILRNNEHVDTYQSNANECTAGTSHHLEVNSATAFLIKKAASGLWSMIEEVCWDIGLMRAHMDATALAEVHALLSSSLSSYFESALNAYQIVSWYTGTSFSRDTCVPHHQDDKAPPVTDSDDLSDASSSCEQKVKSIQADSGLMLQNNDFDTGNQNKNERLDYVITQLDVSRMERLSSSHHQLDTPNSIHQVPTTTTETDCNEEGPGPQSICSSHREDEDSVDDFLLRNARIIEDYFDNAEDATIEPECKKHDTVKNEQAFSWLIVSSDTNDQDLVTRLSNSTQSVEDDIPNSISICQPNDSVNIEPRNTEMYCTICQELLTVQDEEYHLRVLTCQHQFHNECIDAWLSERRSGKNCNVLECPVCDESQKLPTKQESSAANAKNKVPQEDLEFAWSFRRLKLGHLLSGLNNKG